MQQSNCSTLHDYGICDQRHIDIFVIYIDCPVLLLVPTSAWVGTITTLARRSATVWLWVRFSRVSMIYAERHFFLDEEVQRMGNAFDV